ncbi:MAG: ATP-binding protein [Anaerolineaceae bacterium]
MFLLPDTRVRQRDYLLEIARALTQELDLDKLLNRILKISIEMLAGHAGLIALRNDSKAWKIRVTQGLPQPFVKYLGPLVSGFKTSEDANDHAEINEIDRLFSDAAYNASLGGLTSVGLPLIAQHNLIGAIYIFRNYPSIFTSNDRSLLSSFADQAAIAVQNAQLYHEISQQKQRMDALLDSVADGMLILTPNLRIERCNPALSRILTENIELIQNRPHDEMIRWAKPPEGLTLEQAVAGGWPLTPHAQLYIEGDLIRINEITPIPVGITYAPLHSAEGYLLNIIALVRDITRFRQADELKSTFISVISHELKTPVALIKGYVSTLRREDATWDRSVVEDSLKVIEEESDRLTSMIENLLDATRLQAGGFKINRTDCQIADLANRVAEKFQTQTSDHTIVVDFPKDFPIVLADETRLEQVLSNLASNSIKYAPSGEIRIIGRVQPQRVIVCVSDQGPGIAQQDIPHVFDRFYRSPDVAKRTKGTGLGLFLSRSIIEAHDGRMWVDSENNQGAHICFFIPRNLE